jgi:opacity protein-like surface antigen
MKRLTLSFILALLPFSLACAGEISTEVNADYSFVGSAPMHSGGVHIGSMEEQSSFLHAVISSKLTEGRLLRFGVEWQRYSFSLPASAPLPNTLQSVNLVAGLDMEFGSWIVRAEAYPGFYSDFHDITSRDFNIPFVIGGTYLVNSELQWVLGLSVDLQRSYPVIPAVGVRWQFAGKWVLNAILPRPRLEYQFNDSTTLFVGGDIKAGTYRVDDKFGSSHGKPALNGAAVDYTEARVGGGASIKATSRVKVDLEAGYMPFREFDFHRADVTLKNDRGAAYGQIIVGCSF